MQRLGHRGAPVDHGVAVPIALEQVASRCRSAAWVVTPDGQRLLHLGDRLRAELGGHPLDGQDPAELFARGLAEGVAGDIRAALGAMSDGQSVSLDLAGPGAMVALHGEPVRGLDGTVLALAGLLVHRQPTSVSTVLSPDAPAPAIMGRAQVEDLLGQLVRASSAAARPVAVLAIDLDDFAELNDTLGEVEGDAVLARVASRLYRWAGATHMVARVGGDEFIVVLDGADRHAALASAAAIQAVVGEGFSSGDVEHRVTASIGVALSSDASPRAADLLQRANLALGVGRRRGVARIEVHSPALQAKAQRSSSLRRDLKQVLDSGGLEVWYQPLVCLDESRLCGFEALVRWQHPIRGMIPPLDFLPIAERSGWMGALQEHVLRVACRQMVDWLKRYELPADVRMAVNLSPDLAGSPAFLPDLLRVLDETGLPARRLTIELTESGLVDNPAVAQQTLAGLHLAGVEVALDDFGTGYSSLSHLIHFPIDVIKVDRSFTSRVEEDAAHARLVRSTIQLGRNLGLRVTAEGVETEGQRRFLQEQHCDQAQGWLFARALPAADLQERYLALHA
jgi:diguanylate cyclase (GGDEF)-like protein